MLANPKNTFYAGLCGAQRAVCTVCVSLCLCFRILSLVWVGKYGLDSALLKRALQTFKKSNVECHFLSLGNVLFLDTKLSTSINVADD